MHLKVILQGELGTFTSRMYKSGHEFRELQALLDRAEVTVAPELDSIGKRRWPSLQVILCNFWCRAPDINTESLKYLRVERALEASTLIQAEEFLGRDNESRRDWLLHRALSLSAAGFAKYRRSNTEIENVRDKLFVEKR